MSAPHTTTTAPPVSHALHKCELDDVITRINKYTQEEIEDRTASIYSPKNDEFNTRMFTLNQIDLIKRLDKCRNLWIEGLESYYKNTVAGDREVRRIVKDAREILSTIRAP
jgi:hypothetical protein